MGKARLFAGEREGDLTFSSPHTLWAARSCCAIPESIRKLAAGHRLVMNHQAERLKPAEAGCSGAVYRPLPFQPDDLSSGS